MTAKNHRICHEIQNKEKKKKKGFRPVVVVVEALDQHKRYKGPPLTGTIRLGRLWKNQTEIRTRLRALRRLEQELTSRE